MDTYAKTGLDIDTLTLVVLGLLLDEWMVAQGVTASASQAVVEGRFVDEERVSDTVVTRGIPQEVAWNHPNTQCE